MRPFAEVEAGMISPVKSSSKAHEPAGLISSFAIIPKCVVGKKWLRRRELERNAWKLKLFPSPGIILPIRPAARR